MSNKSSEVCFGGEAISIEDVVGLAEGRCKAKLSTQDDFKQKINEGAAFLEKLLKEDGVIYGVTTGYGDSCTVNVPGHLVNELPINLTRYHGCGLGDYFSEKESIAILAARLASLSQGYSGVRWGLLEQLSCYINQRVAPLIPQEGSVGASGDLTPLSYVAASLIGERKAYFKGEIRLVEDILKELSVQPINLYPKEGLAIMNGTAVMTALACLAWTRADYLAKLCTRLTSLASLALLGNSTHFDEILFSVKPHAGQQLVAERIRHDLNHHEHPRNSARLQDRYSIRCSPHIIGVLVDALPWMKRDIENELNSANDNPIIDGHGEHVLHGGHFYGGHIAFVMDSMKNCVANLADLMDRQLALLVDQRFNHGLSSNLSGAVEHRAMINHGFKAVQIGASAWTAEALKLTMPASVFSRSTECHNQDKVSMGTIAARDCLRVLQLTEQVAAAMTMATVQGIRLRVKENQIDLDSLTKTVLTSVTEVENLVGFLEEDRPLEDDLRALTESIQQQQFTLY
ncbi:HAL/PAL/TAL family ammonia-lyase [Pleionea sediminis]|uniref:HAL/PAL/TAL family ammonia-lyase n=1 Tax=Pleionea sediminis TaxID=2569479 RepID=UPI00118703A7|nr:aromatic amino acid ammonia-lyase [Pleionea sediminis]